MSNHSERSDWTAEQLGDKLKKSRERARGKAEQLVGAAKNRVGRMLGNERMTAEGKAKELMGEARQKANR
jgi:uncharacterized protein YjbJ (UPF0337 family)